MKDGRATVADCSIGIWSAAKTVGTTAKSSLEDDVLADLKDTDRKVVAGALRQVASLGTRRGREALRQFLASEDADIHAAAVLGLLRLGDTGGLSAADTLEGKKIEDWFVLSQIHAAIAAIKDKTAVPDLIRLSRSSHDSLVKSASYALRELKSPDSASRLAELLDHPNSDVRYNAIAGLDAIEHGEDAETPSVASFEKNPDRFVTQWKNWWTNTGRRKYQK
jgi:HEAT repeat protein